MTEDPDQLLLKSFASVSEHKPSPQRLKVVRTSEDERLALNLQLLKIC